MKIEVGMWARKENELFECTMSSNEYEVAKYRKQGFSEFQLYDKLMEHIANTPQELIEVGDLVYGDNYITPREVYSVDNPNGTVTIIEENYYTYPLKTITKILTPNSNGGYDLQWEAL